MRLALRHQIILAPASVLLLMAMVLAFLQFTYWDLSVKRQQANSLKASFIALAEADLAARRMLAVVGHLAEGANPGDLAELEELHAHLAGAFPRVVLGLDPDPATRALMQQAIDDLDPQRGIDGERMLSALNLLRPQLAAWSELTQQQREGIRESHSQDIDELVTRTALVSLVVLGAAILLGVLLSLTFARRILRRIQRLSAGAVRIADGELTPIEAPVKSRDELDDLALSINRMSERLIRVVSTEKLLEGAEEERRRIAMDIHDQTLADLSSVLRGLQTIQASESCRNSAAELEAELRRAIANLREVMDDLHPQTLDILGLGAALQSHLEQHLLRDGLPTYHLYLAAEAENAPLPRHTRLALYRIALEAVHNVVKHARAERYEVGLTLQGTELILSVEDNGIGFTLPADGGSGRGLNNIRERARAIGARVEWRASRFSSGTRFELRLPLAPLLA